MIRFQALIVVATLGSTCLGLLADAPRPRADRSGNIDELVAIIYGETSGLRPVWKNPKGPRHPSNHDLDSVRQLLAARQWIGEVALNRGRQGVADPTYLTRRERKSTDVVRVWQDCQLAASTAWGRSDPTGKAMHYLLRKGGTPQAGGLPRRPNWARGYVPARSFGPFRCVGGGDVPAGDDIYIDFFDDIPL
jgi:hypothetical protein